MHKVDIVGRIALVEALASDEVQEGCVGQDITVEVSPCRWLLNRVVAVRVAFGRVKDVGPEFRITGKLVIEATNRQNWGNAEDVE